MKTWSLARFAASSRQLRAILTCVVGICLVLSTGYWDLLVHSIEIPIVRTTLEVFRDFAREVGFALVVAVVIWTVFEYFARAENEALWDERMRDLASNVFYSATGRDFPIQYHAIASEIAFHLSFMRSGWTLHYSIRDAEIENDGECVPFVSVTCTSKFEIANITSEVREFPCRVGLPIPPAKFLRDHVAVLGYVVWKDGVRSEFDLQEAQRHFTSRQDDDGATEFFSLGAMQLKPREKLEVSISFKLAKLPNDTELVQTVYPSDSLRISIEDHGPKKRKIGACSIHPDNLETVAAVALEGSYHYRISRYLLPHNGAAFWWNSIAS